MNEKREQNKIIESEIGMTLAEERKRRKKRKNILSLTHNNILTGIIFSEILGKPKSRKNRGL
ncbi:hypothetical protein R9X47_06900 [Wukongibacter baidiensis]|uniref:hypothetical protein n=1 Tax=Wukongibacter baidiensis TaxID=1723361 RepID=UPI003D7F6DC8